MVPCLSASVSTAEGHGGQVERLLRAHIHNTFDSAKRRVGTKVAKLPCCCSSHVEEPLEAKAGDWRCEERLHRYSTSTEGNGCHRRAGAVLESEQQPM